MLYSDVALVLLACWNRAFGNEGVAESFWEQQQRRFKFWHLANRYLIGDLDDPSTLRLTKEAYHEFF